MKVGAMLLVAALLGVSPAAAAFTSAELMQLLAAVPSSHVEFVETRESAMLKTPLVTSGRLFYRRPDRLEKHVQKPFVETVTIEGSRVTISRTDGQANRVIAVPAGSPAHALIESLRATLAGDLPALERHFDVGVGGSRASWTMALTPKGALPIAKVGFAGREGRIERIEVAEASGDRTVTTIGDDVR